MSGATNEAMALTNWPKVSVLASFSPLTMHVMSGLRDTCISVFPIPSRQKETSMTGKVYIDLMKNAHIGRARASAVTTRLSSTVLRLPILFIINPVGTDRKKNQRNTMDGRKLATVSDSAKSAFT